MKHDLPQGAPLFGLLFDLADRMQHKGMQLHVIGGLAMHFWHREHQGTPRTTEDIDCAFTVADWPDEQLARPRILALLKILDQLELRRDTSDEAKASRTARFTYLDTKKKSKVELICGGVSFGTSSRRTPAWRLLKTAEGNTVYASRLDWLDLVPSWTVVEVRQAERNTQLMIPSLAGLLLLKLKAVTDKLCRCDEERDPDLLRHELDRLERHAGDLLELFAWASKTGGTFAEYATVRRNKPEVSEASDFLLERVQRVPVNTRHEELFGRLREIAVQL